MTGRQAMRRCFISLLLLMIGTSLAVAQPFTRRSSQVQHDGLKKSYEIANFRLGGKYDLSDPYKWENGGEGGTTLESLGAGKLRTAYIALGTPRRSAPSEIINAVVINSYYSGDSTDMYEQWVKGTALSGGDPVIGPGRPIDTDRYYVIMVDPLGTWGASKPSDGLGIKFPQYSYYDMVQANYRMLRDHLKVAQVALITGVSMGGTQTYVWGVMHPEFMGGLMPIGETHNVNPYLGRIQARTMVMHITNDLWLNFKLAERAVDRVPGAQLIAEESPVAHYGVFSIVNHRKNDPKFVAFMDDVASLDRAQRFVDKNYRVPGVAENIDPNKSFWKEYVTYPYPVKCATVKDKRGTSWQIGYMDEYAGTDKDPKVLVIIHGKGAFGGHYGNIMQYALRNGLRVIVPDLPHYGMSMPA